MEYTLNMVFNTAGGKKTTFSITDVNNAVTPAEVNSLMNTILTENIFSTSSGDLVSKASAAIVAKTVTEVAMS
ncbi:DUF2922 family protein [Clostridium chromiireducens]|uniref:DUF2922 family protein n=1 Tax=Clostridium chromiireducens TaxID=225345 RepID=A0A964RTF1_9CLOT|nr:DUF2922 domain-containing protein [Clostridium chromiireducens]MVX67502.1 DUF2922 family protein [Clostridium chromiireducens]